MFVTEKDLKQIYYITREINMWQRELDSLKNKSKVSSPVLTGMPEGKGTTGDRVGNSATRIAYLEQKIKDKKAELEILRTNVIEYIMSIDDSLTRQIVKLRCIDLKSWTSIAIEIGGNNTAGSVRKWYVRHIKKNLSQKKEK